MDDAQHESSSLPNMTKVIGEVLERGSTAVVITVMSGMESVGSKLLVHESGETVGSLGDTKLDDVVLSTAESFLHTRDDTRMMGVKEFAPEFSTTQEVLLLFERLSPVPRLVVCGAGHVGAALAKLGAFVGYHTTLIDDREQFVRADRFPGEDIELVVAEDWRESVRTAIGNGKGVAVAVVTRGHNEDERCMEAIMNTAPNYVGLIGSKRRTNIVIDHLRRAGVSEERLTSIRAPIGLDLGAVTPEEVAIAIIAEIIAERRGGKGGSLSTWRRG
jgi:xanthine dehydrogenase accessory factor